ncbi:MAG TPA: 50S ribosomal protein L24 [Candidatus Portnoybacteria bacterium]|nr:50S ribosomal protein L24 [Candidatus Portnoybacteria bacterium]
MKIKNGENVKIINGRDRNKTDRVLKVFPELKKVMVEGLNLVKKRQKSRQEGKKGQIVEVARPINVSKIKFICPKCGKPARIGYNSIKNNKIRVCKKCQSEV